MKNIIRYIAYPLLLAATIGINIAILNIIGFSGMLILSLTISVLIYIFAGGFIISKIKDDRVMKISLTASAIIMLIAGIICAVKTHTNSDVWGYISYMVSPVAVTISESLDSLMSGSSHVLSAVISTILFPISVLISYISSFMFKSSKKSVRILICIVMLLIALGVCVRGICSTVALLPML